MPVPAPAAVERHPHLADPVPEGFVRVDCHSHTMWSGDSTTTPDELVEAVSEAGIDVLCITDHNQIKGALELRDRLPCRVVVGEEIRTGRGEIIGLFLTERIPFGPGPVEVAERIREQGGIVYIPHPFDPMRNMLDTDVLLDLIDRELVDAIEGRNAKTSLASLNRRAVDAGHEHGLAIGAGSDAHVPQAIGAAYAEIPDFDGPESFLAALRAGRIVGHHSDPHRPWTPRIVPSIS